jgi:hypothetical protein
MRPGVTVGGGTVVSTGTQSFCFITTSMASEAARARLRKGSVA